MSTRTARTEPVVTVPLEELGLTFTDHADAQAYCAVTGVSLHIDFADRPAVSLRDAYKLAEQRRAAAREYADAESRRHSERARAVESLRDRMSSAFTAARDAAIERLAEQPAWAPGERHAEAVNAGLGAARSLWCAAPPEVREQVPVVEFVAPDGTLESIDLGTVIPRPVVEKYLHDLARR